MEYHFSKTAGYYGIGGWVVFGYDYMGRRSPYYVMASEQEAKDKGAKKCKGCENCGESK